MKIEKRTENCYRVRYTYKCKTYSLTFGYKPTAKEVMLRISEKLSEVNNEQKVVGGSFEHYANEYISKRSNVLSPSSIITYERLVKAMSSHFKNINIYDITTDDIQSEINDYAENHAPKTVRSMHGFIAAIMGIYRPNLKISTTLPQAIIKDRYLPTEDDIKAILEISKGTEDHVAFQLGILSLRRSEICALSMEDLKGNELKIHKNKVYNKKWIIKENPKTDASNRTIVLPDSLVQEINDQGYFFKYSPNKLLEHLHNYQKELGIQEFRFHDLRAYFASYASTKIPEADAMAIGGWKSDYVFKEIYRKSMEKSRKESSKKMANILLFDGQDYGQDYGQDILQTQ